MNENEVYLRQVFQTTIILVIYIRQTIQTQRITQSCITHNHFQERENKETVVTF